MPIPQKIKMYYDPLGRVVKTVNPNNSQQWVISGIPNDLLTPSDPVSLNASYIPTPWVNFTYDSNDLAPITNPTGSNVPSDHYYTPKSAEVDALGRTIKTIEHIDKVNNPPVDNIEMNYFYDVRGNLLLVKDPYDRDVFEHVYDLRPESKDKPAPPIKTVHIDKGLSTILFDSTGKPIESFDAKGAQGLSAYDVLQRSTNSWAKNDSTFTDCTLRNYMIYGEAAGTPATYNLNGKVYESYDEAGMVQFPLYDFKGNNLTKTRKVIDYSVLKTALSSYTNYIMDWDSPPTLSAMVFTSDMEYDALNRVTLLTLPYDTSVVPERKKIVPTYNNAGGLQKVELDTLAGNTTYVEDIFYNAKGQRLLIAFGNLVMSRYVYDPITFRLVRQRSEKYTRTQVGDTITYAYDAGTLRQDDGFNFDLVGNIVKLLDRMKDCGIVSPDALDREFEYDPIYRLTYADGRESNSQNVNDYIYTDAPIPTGFTDVRAYSRTYDYDKLGNVQNVIQAGVNGFTRHFEYNTGVNTLQEINTGGVSPSLIEDYTYDSNGNQLNSNLNRHYIWNHADQLICYKNQVGAGTPTIFTQYDYSGQDRVSKMVKTGTNYERTIYIDGVFEYCFLETLSTTYEKNYIHIMDDKSRIAEVRINDGTAFPGDITDAVTYIIEDQIGSSVMRCDTSGAEIDREEYYPFGDSSLRTFTYKRYRYVGKEKDSESGLYYYGARYYAAWTCRFISVDPLAEKFAQLSPFNYSENNPINDKDIDGMQKGDSKQSAKGGNSGANGAKASSTNTGAGTNATNANKLPGFTPSTGTPYKAGDLKAAGTDGGGGATKLQNLKVGPTSNEKPVVGHQYPKGTFEGKAADPTPRAAASNNTTGLAGDASNPAPTGTQLLEEAFEMISSGPEIQIGKGALSGSTSGEVTAGIQKNDPNLSGNLFTGEMNKIGAVGVMASSESLEYGPYAVSNSVNTINRTNVQHDAALTPTAIVETSFIIQDRIAQLGGGIAETKVTVAESKTLIPSGQIIPTSTVGVVKQKFATAGFNLFGFQVQVKAPRN